MKTGIRVHGLGAVDDIWKTCCALHNMLLEVDGLAEDWREGVTGDWEGDWGLHEREDSTRFGISRDHDLSGLGGMQDSDVGASAAPTSGTRTVRNMELSSFRSSLIEHFTLKWRAREVRWPSRNGDREWAPSAVMRSQAAELGIHL